MNCIRAQQLVKPYLDGQLSDREVEAFLDHVDHCEVCRDELEVYYLIDRTLADGEEDGNYNFIEKLSRRIEQSRRDIARRRSMRVAAVTDLAVAGLILFAVISARLRLFAPVGHLLGISAGPAETESEGLLPPLGAETESEGEGLLPLLLEAGTENEDLLPLLEAGTETEELLLPLSAAAEAGEQTGHAGTGSTYIDSEESLTSFETGIESIDRILQRAAEMLSALLEHKADKETGE